MLHDLQGLGSLTKIWRSFSDAWDRDLCTNLNFFENQISNFKFPAYISVTYTSGVYLIGVHLTYRRAPEATSDMGVYLKKHAYEIHACGCTSVRCMPMRHM